FLAGGGTGSIAELVRRERRLEVGARRSLPGSIVEADRGVKGVTVIARPADDGPDVVVDFQRSGLETLQSQPAGAGTEIDRLRTIDRRGNLELWAVTEHPRDRLVVYRRSDRSSDWRLARNSHLFSRGDAADLRPIDIAISRGWVYVLCRDENDDSDHVVVLDVSSAEPLTDGDGDRLSTSLPAGADALATNRRGQLIAMAHGDWTPERVRTVNPLDRTDLRSSRTADVPDGDRHVR
ncbi:MAG: hypothetical protein ABEL76_00190, partial [Bradymonadaceae bacterium]